MNRTAQRIEELASFASVHLGLLSTGQWMVSILPAKSGTLWWYECSEDLDQAVKACRVKAGQYGFLPRHEAPPTPPEDAVFQARAGAWVLACFGDVVAGDKVARNHRFLEEALELVQACGGTSEDAHILVDYVFGRPVGEKDQEVGGVMMTLAALCNAQGLDMHGAGDRELARVWTKVDAIRAKQASKPNGSPLPGGAPTGHVLYETGDPGAPNEIKDRNGEVCLGLCKVCGKAEVELEGVGCLPRWADAEIAPGTNAWMVLNAQLPTRDGRRVGNAVLIKVEHLTEWVFTVKTDAGNTLVLSERELRRFFHQPRYVMRADLVGVCLQREGPRRAARLSKGQVDAIFDTPTPAGCGKSRYDLAREVLEAAGGVTQPGTSTTDAKETTDEHRDH